MLRPRMRMPMWAAVAVVAAAYLVRSSLRGWDFRPDLPMDAIVLALLVAFVVLRGALARSAASDEGDDPGEAEVRHEDDPGDDPGSDGQVGPGIEP